MKILKPMILHATLKIPFMESYFFRVFAHVFPFRVIPLSVQFGY